MNDQNPYSASSHELQSGDDDGRKRWPSNIGLVLAIALGCVVQLIASQNHYFSSVQPSVKAIGFVLDLCQGALAGVGLLTRESQVWRIYAWLNVALYIGYLLRLPLDAGGQFALTYEPPPSPFATVTLATIMLAMWAARLTLVIGLVQDWRQRTRRDLPHWLGLILGTISPSTEFILRIFVVMTIAR